MQRIYLKSIHLLLLSALIFTIGAPAVNPTVQADSPAAPTAQEVPAPVLLTTTPANGARWDGSPVIFAFNEPLAAAELAVTPELAGTTTLDGADVIFTPAVPPAPNTRYHFSFVEATAASGAAATGVLDLTLQSTGPLGVLSTQPADGAADVDPHTPITVVFNRPVVPLVGIAEQASLPQPLDFSPSLAGSGQWVSTSVYQFTPALSLAAATTYDVRVAPLTAVDGSTLADAARFSFSTSTPIVVEVRPAGILVSPDTQVTVTFSQAMDRASTEAAFNLQSESTPSIAGSFGWDDTQTVLTFTPAERLPFGNVFAVEIAATALAQSRAGGLREGWSSEFTVVPTAAVQSTSILPDARGVSPENELRIAFTAPVSETLLYAALRIEGLLTTTQVISYTYTDLYELTGGFEQQVDLSPPPGYNTHLMLNWYKQPNTTYTVTVDSRVASAYGNLLP